MDLPADKARTLRNYNDERKWELIRDQEMVKAKESPKFYLDKLRSYLDPKTSRNSKRKRAIGDTSSTQVLRDLEISLRTNNIEWVREFLSEENGGLDILIEYLTVRLNTQRLLEQQKQLNNNRSIDGEYGDRNHSSQPTSKTTSPTSEIAQGLSLFRLVMHSHRGILLINPIHCNILFIVFSQETITFSLI